MKFILTVASILILGQHSMAVEVCGITINSENSKYFIEADGKSESEKGFRAVMPYLKYHYTNDSMNAFTLLGEYKLNPAETEFLGQDEIRALAPDLIEKVRTATPDANFDLAKGDLIVDESSRIDLNFSYEIAGTPLLESRLLIFQSPSCRIDAVFVATDGNEDTLNDVKNELINAIHKSGKGNLWILPDATKKTPFNLTRALVIGFVGSLIGFIVAFVVEKIRKSKKPVPK